MIRRASGILLLLTTVGALLPEQVEGCAIVRRRANPAIQVAGESAIIIWDASNKTQHFIRRASFQTEAGDFGFLVPTPTKPELAEAADEAFSFLTSVTAPRVIYRWLKVAPGARPLGKGRGMAARRVTVLETKRVAGYDAVVLEASDPEALNAWLKKHDYQSGPELVKWLEPYVKDGWKVTAFKIAKDEPKKSGVATAAVRMTFQTERPYFPYREPAARGDVEPGRIKQSSRLLRVFFLGERRVEGSLGKDGVWPGVTVWANKLGDEQRSQLLEKLKLDKLKSTESWWLTELEDRSSPRPGTDDVFFAPSEIRWCPASVAWKGR